MPVRSYLVCSLIFLAIMASVLLLAGCSQPAGGPAGGPGPGADTPVESLEPGYPRPPTEVPTAVPEGYVPPALRTATPEPTP